MTNISTQVLPLSLLLCALASSVPVLANDAATQVAADATQCAGECHNIKPYVDGLNNPNLLLTQHAQVGIGCEDCHEQTDETRKEEQQVYQSGDYDNPMYTREFDAEFCFRCHGSYAELAKKTEPLVEKLGRNPHKSHMGEVDCYECHKVHQASTFACAECHFSKWEELLPPGWKTKQ